MGCYSRRRNRPKSRSAIDESIHNGAIKPDELLRFEYRRVFGLTAKELSEEPIDQFFTNSYILAQIADRQRIKNEHGIRE